MRSIIANGRSLQDLVDETRFSLSFKRELSESDIKNVSSLFAASRLFAKRAGNKREEKTICSLMNRFSSAVKGRTFVSDASFVPNVNIGSFAPKIAGGGMFGKPLFSSGKTRNFVPNIKIGKSNKIKPLFKNEKVVSFVPNITVGMAGKKKGIKTISFFPTMKGIGQKKTRASNFVPNINVLPKKKNSIFSKRRTSSPKKLGVRSRENTCDAAVSAWFNAPLKNKKGGLFG